MSSRIPSPPRSLVALVAALFVAGAVALWAADAPPAPPAGSTLPAAGGAQEPGSDKPKPNATPTAPGAAASTDDNAPKGKEIVVRADRDYEIERTVGRLLEEHHYLQHPIDATMSQRWLSNYLIALDGNHLFFLQSDIDEFTQKYGNTLGDLLHGDDEQAAIEPAFKIFERFLQRVKGNVTLAESLVHQKYDFTKNDSFTMPTDKSPWLKDQAASDALWHAYVKSDMLNGVLDKKPLDVTAKRLTKRYDALMRYWGEMDDLDVLEQYLCGLTHAYDPHSDYFQPDESENFSIQAIDHSVTGIGAELRSDDGYAVIQEVISGGPADLDKRLKPGDKIIAVGQGTKEPVDAVNMRLNRVVDMIRGEKGTMVHLVIQPAGAGDAVHKDIILKRDLVSLKDSLAKADIIEHPVAGGVEKIGVIHLHDFYNNTSNDHSAASDCAKLITRLKKEKVAAIILDMRNNGGGLLDQAINLAALFVKDEPVVQVRRSDGDTESLRTDNSTVLYNGPLVVMVNKMSASATEIVAAALQDYGRAVIVGDKSTHGKGTVQTLIRLDQAAPLGVILDPGNELKMTVQKFYRVAGGSTQEKGVIPDIVLPSLLDAFELGETTLKYYLPYDTIPPVQFDQFNLAAPYVADLKARSDARVASSTDFNYLRQDIAFYKKRVNDTTVSLNEAARQKESDDLKATELARKKDLENRKAGRDKDLELTLDMVQKDLPAAPPEVKKPVVDPDDSDSDSTTPDLESTLNAPTVDPQLNEAVDITADYVKALQGADSKLVQTTPATTTAAAPEKQPATTP
jgi:carboxyl-terminal processing protease